MKYLSLILPPFLLCSCATLAAAAGVTPEELEAVSGSPAVAATRNAIIGLSNAQLGGLGTLGAAILTYASSKLTDKQRDRKRRMRGERTDTDGLPPVTPPASS